ncbi:muts domain V-domain-containing protein [Auriculariales sp. MPI-PUGE-AT-0066]|nr:muts domain V-domain-containing protein [Auriculariales sp. MPI-PUGE-AT-0066]
MISRPTTAASMRPTTAQSTRPPTAARGNDSGRHVVAINESRGVSREVGIAALDRDGGRVMLFQIADCQTYVKTLHHLDLYTPQMILMPDTAFSSQHGQDSLLLRLLQDEFSHVPIEPVARRYWNDAAGHDFINQLCADDEDRAAILVAVATKFYALSATSALFKFTEIKLNCCYASHSLRFEYVSPDGTMLIDTETARNLELVANMTWKKSSHSLYGLLNHTTTPMAARLLRVNLLAPLTVASSLEARLDAVEEIVKSEDKYASIRDGIRAFGQHDLDKLISSLAASEVRETANVKFASLRISQMLVLRTIVRSLPSIHNALSLCRSRLLTILTQMISDPRFERIDELISGHLNDDAVPQKSGGILALNMRVYAVKANCNTLLDVARETFKENVADIFALSRSVSDDHNMPVNAVYHDNGGFWFSVKKRDLDDGELPRGLIHASSRGQNILFSSLELQKLNQKVKDSLTETLVLSDKTIDTLVSEVLIDAGALYKASEAVAILDMLWSFAHVSIIECYTRPDFTETLAIDEGRHPILEKVSGNRQTSCPVVPNDVFCTSQTSFQLVQGPSALSFIGMSGKSTYLRQIALITVMAMCGCFVPAKYACIKLHDALLSRLSNDDDMERNLSTFANEMATSAMILGLATDRSLVLVDELGRGTSPVEGMGIAHAIAEKLIESKAFVFFTTHFSDLVTTLSKYPPVVCLHLTVQRARTNNPAGMVFHYKISDGAATVKSHYGLDVAQLADLPSDVLVEAQRVASRLGDLHDRQHEASLSQQLAERRKLLLRTHAELKQLLDHSSLPDSELENLLKSLQREMILKVSKTFREA